MLSLPSLIVETDLLSFWVHLVGALHEGATKKSISFLEGQRWDLVCQKTISGIHPFWAKKTFQTYTQQFFQMHNEYHVHRQKLIRNYSTDMDEA